MISLPYVKRVLAVMFVIALVGTIQGAQKPTPPASEVEILQPSAGAVVSESTNVSVRITPPEKTPLPSQVYAGIDGAPWVKLERSASEENLFSGSIDSRMDVIRQNHGRIETIDFMRAESDTHRS